MFEMDDFLPKPIDFDKVWSSLFETTHSLIVGECRVPKNEWNERISDVYDLCVAQPKPFGDKLYEQVQTLLDAFVCTVYQHIQELVGADLLIAYFYYWRTYSTAVPYLNRLYSCLNTQLISRTSKLKHIDIEYWQLGILYDEHRLEIGELALDLWERGIILAQKYKLVHTILDEIDKDRRGIIVNHGAIQGVILSFVDILQYQPGNQLRLYEDLFEIPFLSSSIEFYKREAQQLRDNIDCSVFMEKAVLRVRDESVRIRRYLHPSTYERVELDCQAWLLCEENIDFINDNCRMMVQREHWKDLSNLCHLLYPLEDSLDVVVAEFEEYLVETALAIMQSLQGDTIPTQFVEGVTEFRSFYIDHIRVSMGSLPLFLRVLDKACYAAVNYRTHPKARCRSPEMLSTYCDDLLRKSCKGVSETEIDEKLGNVIIIFNYLEDKDLFQHFYARNLAKRLLLRQSQSMDTEELMLNRLKQVCGYDYTSKLNRMFTDITISSDLNQTFSDYTKDCADSQLPFAVALSILQGGAWPIDQANTPTFSLPQEMEKGVRVFEQFYSEHYCGRKLTWMFHLSQVELRFLFRKRAYIVTMEMHTMGVLMAFNGADIIGYQDLLDITQLSDKDLLKQLHLLVDAKILLTAGQLTKHSRLALNLHYSNRRTKFKVLPVQQAEVIRETVQTHISIEEDRRLFIEAAVVRIMKARRELKHNLLIQEVIGQARTRFIPRVAAIKRCIEMLIDKQYLERSEDSKETYLYRA